MLAVTQATKAGFDNVPRILSMAGRNLGARGRQLFLARDAARESAISGGRAEARLGIRVAVR